MVRPIYEPAAPDTGAELRRVLRHPVAGPPLRERLSCSRTVAVSVCDLTRPQPHQAIVRAVLDEMDGLVSLDDVTILVATGTHRGNTTDELREMLGDEISRSARVVNHDARNAASLTWRGIYGNDVPVWLNSEWVAADFRITTGFVEAHFFAGSSGGPKLATPGLSGLDTVLTLHNAVRIGHRDARWVVCVGNPVHDDVRAAATGTGSTLPSTSS